LINTKFLRPKKRKEEENGIFGKKLKLCFGINNQLITINGSISPLQKKKKI